MSAAVSSRTTLLCAAILLPVVILLSALRESEDTRAIVFSGTVTIAGTGAPIDKAQIAIAPWNAGALTDANGRYSVTVPAATRGQRAILTVRFLGYQDVSKEVRVEADSVRTDFELQAAVLQLRELAATGQQGQAGSPAVAGVTIHNGSSSGIMLRSAGGRGGMLGYAIQGKAAPGDPEFNTEAYAPIAENEYYSPRAAPLSTFSIDVDRASYANVRRFLRDRRMPPKDAVRIEELVNYFTYDDPAPTTDAPFAVRTELSPAPWRPEHKLLRIGIKARDIPAADAPPNNLVFLIDVSGSMQSPDKLPLLKQAFALLVNELRPADRVALVVYASATGLVLPSRPGSDKETILAAIERLEAGGSTAGGAGLRLAYDVARQHHIEGGNNRVILATDGDFNVGASSDAEMMRLVEEKRAQGTFLTVLGFGTGNLKDAKMELMADKGNGNYSYIDEIAEARKVLVHELGGTLLAVAKDVKIQVEFDPARVAGYRLIGYENRLLAAEDFNDDRKDAGELGAGHSVTALYEIVPAGIESDVVIRIPDSLRYQTRATIVPSDGRGEIAFVKLRYKQPDGETSVLMEHPVAARDTRPSADFTFSAAVASFGMVLRDSPHRGNATLDRVLALAKDGLGEDRGGYRAGFIQLLEQAKSVQAIVAGDGGGR
jgi:Ca-activated chloride channel family protein